MSPLAHLASKPRRRLLATALGLAFAGLAPADPASAAPPISGTEPAWCSARCDDLVIDWNALAYQAIKAADGYADPLHASRALTMMHLAMHDAVNAVQPRFERHVVVDRDTRADAAVAAASAAHDVLLALYPSQKALLKAALDQTLVEAGTSTAALRGVALGARVAAAMLVKRARDGAQAKLAFAEGQRPGEYRYTPGFDFVAHPQWRQVQPFTLNTPGQFRSAPPPALTSVAYAIDFEEVKAVGSKAPSAKRSADETHLAAFWYEFSDIGWNRIARVVARGQRQDLWQRARTFALLNAAMADAYIAGWDAKFHHNLWRPVTAIHAADADGNDRTAVDAAFEPLLPTPPVQDYPSTHSALGAAAAIVLARSFGNDRIAFAFSSTSAMPDNPVRRFGSFSEAARENADSRVKAGIHFRFATVAGLQLGERIGANAMRHSLAPLD